MSNRRAVVLTSLVFVAWGSTAGADVIFSNLGPGDSFGVIGFGFGDASGDNNRGARFIVGAQDFLFTSAEAALGLGSPPDSVTLGLRADNGSVPGALLQTFGASGLPPVSGGIVTFGASAPLVLSAGTTYWLTTEEYSFSNGGNYVWRENNTGINTANAVRIGNGAWFVTAQGTPAFRINGDPVVTAPEPGSLMLLAGGFVSLWALRRRQRLTDSR